LFFKQKDAFAQQVGQWSRARLTRALERITETQRLTRSGPQLTAMDEIALIDALVLDLARLAAHRPRAGAG
jgi:DNA polymerase III delta subunit